MRRRSRHDNRLLFFPRSSELSGGVNRVNVDHIVLRVERSGYFDVFPFVLLGLLLIVQLIGGIHGGIFQNEFLATLGDPASKGLDFGLLLILLRILRIEGGSWRLGI